MDIRWIQRFANYRKALAGLEKAISLRKNRKLSELEEQGLIKSFELTYELCWLTLKDYFEYQGETSISGSRDAFRMAFQRGVIEEGQRWMEMIEGRKKSVHTYDQEMSQSLASTIVSSYFPLFKKARA